MIAKKDFGGFRARLLNGASVAAVLAVGITVGMGGASPARAADAIVVIGVGPAPGGDQVNGLLESDLGGDQETTVDTEGEELLLGGANGRDAVTLTVARALTLLISDSDPSSPEDKVTFADDINAKVAGSHIVVKVTNTNALFRKNLVHHAGGTVKIIAGNGNAAHPITLTFDTSLNQNMQNRVGAAISAESAEDIVNLVVANSGNNDASAVTFGEAVGGDDDDTELGAITVKADDTANLKAVFEKTLRARALAVEADANNNKKAVAEVVGDLIMSGGVTVVAANDAEASLKLQGAVINVAGGFELDDNTGLAILTLDSSENAMEVTGAINGVEAGEGAVVVVGAEGAVANLVTFKSQIGRVEGIRVAAIRALKIGSAAVGGNAKFEESVHALAITIEAGDGGEAESSSAAFAGDITATTITLNGNGQGKATVTFDGTGDQTIKGNIVAAAGGEGLLVVANTGGVVTVVGGIGTAGSQIGAVTIVSGAVLTQKLGTAPKGFFVTGNVGGDEETPRGGTLTIQAGDATAAAAGASVDGQSVISGNVHLTALNIKGGAGWSGGVATRAGGMIMGFAVTGTTKAAVAIDGGAGGTGQAGGAAAAGGAGGAVAGAVAFGGLVTGSVVLTGGKGGKGGAGEAGAAGGAGGAGGAVAQVDIGGGLTGALTLISGAGGNAGGGVGNEGGKGGDGGAVTLTSLTDQGTTGAVIVASGTGGTGGDSVAAHEGKAGGAGGLVTITDIADDIASLTVVGGAGGTGGIGGGANTKNGGIGGIGGPVVMTISGKILGGVSLQAGAGGAGGAAGAGAGNGGKGGAGSSVTLTMRGAEIGGAIFLDDGADGEAGSLATGDEGEGGDGGKAVIKFEGDADQKVTGAVTVGADGEGEIEILNGANTITFEAAIGQAQVGDTPAVKLGTLKIGASGVGGAKAVFKKDVFADAITVGVADNVNVVTTAVFEEGVTFSTLKIIASTAVADDVDTTVTAKGNLDGETITFTDAADNSNSVLTLAGTEDQTQTVTAEIVSTVAGQGVLKVNNNAIFMKDIGKKAAEVDQEGEPGHEFARYRLASISVGEGKTMTLGDGARTVGATAFNLADKATLVLTGTLTLGESTVLRVTGDTATLKLEPKTTFAGSTVIDATNNGAGTVVVKDDAEVTVIPPASFVDGKLILIDVSAAVIAAGNAAGRAAGLAKLKVAAEATLADYELRLGVAATDEDNVGDVILTATPKDAEEVADSFGTTADAAGAVLAAAGALQRASSGTADDDADAVADAVAAQAAFNAVFETVSTPAEKKAAKEAAEQLQPSPSTAGAIVALVTSTGAVSLGVSSSRLASLRGGSAFTSTAAASGFAAGEGAAAKSVWLKPFANMATQDAKSGIAGFKTKTGGIAFGADITTSITTSKNVTLGAAVSYAASSIDSKDVSKTDTDIKSYQFTVYGGYATDKWYVEAMAAYAKNKVDTTRKIAFGGLEERKAKGKYDADQYMLRVGGGMPIAVGTDAFVTPTLGFQWSRVSGEAYTETGAGSLNLKVKPGDVDTRLATAGVRFHKSFKKAKWTVVPEVRAGLMYDFSDDGAVSTSTFTGGGASFKTKAAKTEKFGGVVGAGLTFMTKKNVSLSANYDLNFKKGFIGHSGILQLRLNF